MKKKPIKKQSTPTIINVLVQAVNDMSSKLHRVHKDVANNSKDINELKQQVSFSKGAVKVLLWLAGAMTTIIAVFQWLNMQ
jgi:methyl-accepting chemotaxis protein